VKQIFEISTNGVIGCIGFQGGQQIANRSFAVREKQPAFSDLSIA
jgi:hypothetical protein